MYAQTINKIQTVTKMSEESLIDLIPIEIFLKLFTYMTTKELVRCRAVSYRWKEIIDDILECEHFWKTKCEFDFANVIQIARFKCRPGMVWSDLYRSLSLWSKLREANEEQDEFCSASIVADEIRSFTILRNGIIGVHKRSSIVYYDVETFKPVNRNPITGDYLRYSENEEMIIILSFHLQLYIIRKRNVGPRHPGNVTYDDVKSFLLLDHCVYYIDMNDNLHKVAFNDRQLKSLLICRSTEGVMAMGYRNDQLQLLTFQRKVYTLVDKKLVFAELLGPTSNLLHQLHKYNLLELLDWRIYFQWMFILNHNIPQGPLQDIVTTRTYGDVVFIGSNWGVLRIYYQPFTSLGEFDLFNAQPIKQYNFMERYDCPVLSMCPILGIDVYEVDNGHMVIVAMPKKIAVLNFTHNYLKTANAALRYPDIPEPPELPEQAEKIKIITIE